MLTRTASVCSCRLFFRRHYAVNTVIFCSLDPQGRKWVPWLQEQELQKHYCHYLKALERARLHLGHTVLLLCYFNKSRFEDLHQNAHYVFIYSKIVRWLKNLTFDLWKSNTVYYHLISSCPAMIIFDKMIRKHCLHDDIISRVLSLLCIICLGRRVISIFVLNVMLMQTKYVTYTCIDLITNSCVTTLLCYSPNRWTRGSGSTAK